MSRAQSGAGDILRSRDGALARGSVGKYRVLFELGRGGMATVHLAVTHSAAGVSKLVVLKTLLSDMATEPDALAMFLDEARLAVQLNHGNLVQTYEVGEDGGRHFIVMEYLEGQSLAAVLRQVEKSGRPLSLGLHLRMLIHVLEGLHYTHELRGYDNKPLHFVHRDVSPQNVFVTYDGRVKVLDFGIAKAATSTTHTATGLVKGKIAYMPPEQMEGMAVDRRADIYAVGCMLWAAATGKKLWKDVADAHILREVLNDGAPSPRRENPECDPELERIVMKALATNVEQRYATAVELQEDLERFCEARGFADRPRELGRLVAELFAQTRADDRSLVERELSRVQPAVALGGTDTGIGSRLALPALEPQQLTASTRTVSVSTVNEAAKAAPRRRRLLWAVPIGLTLATSVYVLGNREQPERDAAAAEPPVPASAASSVPAPASAPAEATVRIELRSTPSTAKLFLDDQPLLGNPSVRILPKDGSLHRVRAELPGHRTATVELRANQDDAVSLNLVPLPKAQGTARATGAPRPAVKSAPKVADGAAGCAQPFYLGADGIKKIKPQCM